MKQRRTVNAPGLSYDPNDTLRPFPVWYPTPDPAPTPTPTPTYIPPAPIPLTLFETINGEDSITDLSSVNEYQITVDDAVYRFSLLVDGISGVDFTNIYDINDFNNCKLIISTTDSISSNKSQIFVNESCTLSTINDDFFTFYYYTTGSVVAKFKKKLKNAPSVSSFDLCDYSDICVTINDSNLGTEVIETFNHDGKPMAYYENWGYDQPDSYTSPISPNGRFQLQRVPQGSWDESGIDGGYRWWFFYTNSYTSYQLTSQLFATFDEAKCPLTADFGGNCNYRVVYKLDPDGWYRFPGLNYNAFQISVKENACPVTPTPTPSVTPTNTITPTPTQTENLTPTPSITPTETPTQSLQLCGLSSVCVTISGANGYYLNELPTTYVNFTTDNWSNQPSVVQVYDRAGWGSDWPLLLKTDPISGYRWQWFFGEGIFLTDWFKDPVCPTSIDNGGICVYELNTGSTNWQWLSAEFNGSICSIKAGDCNDVPTPTPTPTPTPSITPTETLTPTDTPTDTPTF